MSEKLKGHLLASITVAVWGTTFISTKVLLNVFNPVEILFLRFILGLIVLYLIYPKKLETKGLKEEKFFIIAGLCGVCLYYLLENIALSYTYASNVSVILSVAPIFTAILSKIYFKDNSLKISFFIGFILAILGICLISFNGGEVSFGPKGDILSILAAITWAIYSICTQKIGEFGYNTIQCTRRIFIYGTLFMLPSLLIYDFNISLSDFSNIAVILNLLFLGVGASAICFVTWNLAVKYIGPVKASVYIYVAPIITVVVAFIVLGEKMSKMAILGTVLILIGLIVSEGKFDKIKKK